jgi:hypothetical protein
LHFEGFGVSSLECRLYSVVSRMNDPEAVEVSQPSPVGTFYNARHAIK